MDTLQSVDSHVNNSVLCLLPGLRCVLKRIMPRSLSGLRHSTVEIFYIYFFFFINLTWRIYLKGRPQIVHINMFFHNCICIKLFHASRRSCNKNPIKYRELSLLGPKPVVRLLLPGSMYAQPPFSFLSCESAMCSWKGPSGVLESAVETLHLAVLAPLSFSAFTSVMWWLVGRLLPHCESWTFFWLLEIRKNPPNAQCWKELLTPPQPNSGDV